MSPAVITQEKTRAVINKAEETIKELEETVQSLPDKERRPSPWLLGAALASIALAITLFSRKRKDDAMFVGLWAPTFLALDMFADMLRVRRKEM